MKQKTYLRLIVMLFVMIVLSGSILNARAADDEPNAYAANDESSIDELMAAQARAVAANEALMQYFFNNGWVQEYPDYFGGCYIEDNILHVQLASPTEQDMDILNQVFASYKAVVVYEFVQHSRSELQEYVDMLAYELRAQGCEVTHWYADTKAGSVTIGVLAESVDSANALIEQLRLHAHENNMIPVIIEEGVYVTRETSIVYGGSLLNP